MNLKDIVNNLGPIKDYSLSVQKNNNGDQRIVFLRSIYQVKDNTPAKGRSFIAPHHDCTEQEILDMIREHFHRIEAHEIDEKFTYKGERIYDPHR